MLNCDGYVAEATGDNVFIVREGVITLRAWYPGRDHRGTVIELARKLGIGFEQLMTLYDVYNANECFLTAPQRSNPGGQGRWKGNREWAARAGRSG